MVIFSETKKSKMAAQIYKCSTCKASMLAFEGEEERLSCKCSSGNWIKTISIVSVMHASSRYMVDYYLDSINTIQDRDAQNRRDAAEERELKHYSQSVIKM